MKKNGFIATSVMFSFFLVFSMLSLLVLASYANYRNLIGNLNSVILQDLNEVIQEKFISLDNLVISGDFREYNNLSANSYWNGTYKNASIVSPSGQKPYMRLKISSVADSQNDVLFYQNFLTKKLIKDKGKRKVYVAFKVFRQGAVPCSSSEVYLGQKGSGSGVVRAGTSNCLCGDFFGSGDTIPGSTATDEEKAAAIANAEGNWGKTSIIYELDVTDNNQQINFEITNFGYGLVDIGGTMHNLYEYPSDVLAREIGIRDIVVVDITNLYNETTTDQQMKEYLDRELPYITNNYPIAKY